MWKQILFYDITTPFKRKKNKKPWWMLRRPLRLRIQEYNKKNKL